MRRFRWIIPVALVLVFLFAAAAPFTATGTRLVVAVANMVPGLSVQHSSGALLGDLEIATVRYAADAVEIELTDISANLQRSCLWESRLCFRRLSAGSLRVDVASRDEQPTSGDESADDGYVSIPFGIRAPACFLIHA